MLIKIYFLILLFFNNSSRVSVLEAFDPLLLRNEHSDDEDDTGKQK